jgi:spore coat polysaccharide biosynthesis predicted glycosyltransferase SpsG
MFDTLHIDDLDGAVTLFKSTDEGTETIAVFDEEHREVIQDLLTEVKRLRKALEIERQIVQAFYEYRDECCFDHCEAWMLEKGYRVMVNGQSEWGEE